MKIAGFCRVCGQPGEVGQRCSSPRCAEHGFHFVTRAAAFLLEETLLGRQLSGKYTLVDRIGVGGLHPQELT